MTASHKPRRKIGGRGAIVTLTLSPALDIATQIPRLRAEAKLRCTPPIYTPGGGGINVARAIHALGGRALALFPAGGASGQQLVELLAAEGVATQPLAIAERTRECLNVLEQAGAQQYRFVLPGACLSAAEQTRLLEAVAALPTPEYLVISGSLPPGLAADFLPRLLHDVIGRGIRCILDSSGEALRQALEVGGVFMIKPNLNELCSLAGEVIDGPERLAGFARELVDGGGCANVLVSLGAQGALLVGQGRREWLAAPTVQRCSTVGAGDSLVAGVTLKLAAGAPWREALCYGVAAGSAAIIGEGGALCRLADTERLFAWLQVHGQG
ncbi:1-phosphofructokinase family hexose kinase [Pseudomonas benzenivorans]|uniref:1-phosphofructokinase family hexose kinase n=1 Tax=Pseudomonas benzenivorans TaxID=556533 RepID=UPI00351683D1